MGRLSKVTAVLFLAACASTANAQSLYQHSPSLNIDWIEESITVSGTATEELEDGANAVEQQLKGIRQAEETLLKNFISSMQELRIDAYRDARHVLLQEPERNKRLYSYYERMKQISVRYSGKNVELQKSFPLYGDKGLLPLLVDAGTDPGNFPVYQEYVFSRPFTGLVIDARGLGKVPSAVPRVFDQSHTLVYSAELMDHEQYRRWGSVQFTDDPFYREYRERVGDYPLQIAAFPDDRLIATDVAISIDDAMVLLQHDASRTSLMEGRVIIILDG